MSIVYCCFVDGYDLALEEDFGMPYEIHVRSLEGERPVLARCLYVNAFHGAYWEERSADELQEFLDRVCTGFATIVARYGSVYCYCVAIYDNPALVVDVAGFVDRHISMIGEDLSVERFAQFVRSPTRYHS